MNRREPDNSFGPELDYTPPTGMLTGLFTLILTIGVIAALLQSF